MGRRGLSEATQAEIWARREQGEPQRVIARALGITHPTITKMLLRSGGYVPRQPSRAARVLQAAEREEISRGVAAGVSVRALARQLGRAPSTISREVARHGGRAAYRAGSADAAAWQRARRPKACWLARQPALAAVVATKLAAKWSPEQIAAWLRQTYPDTAVMQVSPQTIYRTLFIQGRGVFRQELRQYLRRGQRFRQPRGSTTGVGGPLADAISIRERPPSAEDRAVPGHWEGDLLSGTIDTQIATLVERQSRFVMLVKLPTKEATAVAQALARHVRTLPQDLRRSLTWDRGREMAAHRAFTIATDVQVYFCDPHSPWQRGSNENTNGLLRQYLPRGTDLSQYSQTELNDIAHELNQRPRKTLGWQTPADKLAAIVASTG